MIKYFCDRCGKEIEERATLIPIYAYDGNGVKLMQFGDKHICEECAKKLEEIRDSLLSRHYEQDFLQMTDEDIELFRYTFKVGDQVITSTGQVGKIIDICTCDNCKERGFYEPRVEVEIGDDAIYITDNDKRDNFRSFYKIGNQVFGNIDEDDVLYDIKSTKEQVKELQSELIELEAQLDVVKQMKQVNKSK